MTSKDLHISILGLPNWFWRVGSIVRRFFYWLEASPKSSSLERFPM